MGASFANSMMCWPRNVSGEHSVCFHVHGAQNAQHTKRFPFEFLHEAGLAGLAFQYQISFRCWTPSHTRMINEWLLQFRWNLIGISSAQYRDAWRYVMHWKVGVSEACHWAATNQCRVAWDGSKLPTHVPTQHFEDCSMPWDICFGW